MNPLRSLFDGWGRLRQAAKQEFLRDPNVILFERVPRDAAPRQGDAGGR